MKKIVFLILFIGTNLIAQTTFKKGYFITQDNTKEEVFFQAYNGEFPESFFYKKDLNSEIVNEILTVNIKELLVFDIVKFIRKEVSIELLEKTMIAKKSNNSEIFSKTNENLLLKVNIESDDFSLYTYMDKETENKYFFLRKNNKLQLLKYKVIIKNAKNYEVKSYRKFLYKNYKIEKSDNINVGKLNYKEKDFEKYFTIYAESKNLNYIRYKSFNRDPKDAININFLVGYSMISQKNKAQSSSSFNTSINTNHINLGVNFEFFFNSSMKKSSILASLVYNTNNSNDEDFAFGTGNSDNSIATNELSFLNLNLKYRQYYKLNRGYIYLNGGVSVIYSLGKTSYTFIPTDAIISELRYDQPNLFLTFGVGYNYDKLGFEINYIPSYAGAFQIEENNATSGTWSFDRQHISLTFSYNVF